MLSREQIDEFKRDGVLVVDQVFSQEEVTQIRSRLHRHLLTNFGIDHDKVLACDGDVLGRLGEPRIKSPISNVLYPSWKLLGVNLDQRLFGITSELWRETYAINAPGFRHPFGDFDPNRGYLYIDRVCYRTPDYVRPEGGLGVHLDRNPFDPYFQKSKYQLSKWRPIQGFVSLVDQYGSGQGGLRCTKRFHLRIDDYFAKDLAGIVDEKGDDLGEGGEFFRLHPTKHTTVCQDCQPIDAPAGSFVLWDNRIPHATDQICNLFDTREVMYTSFLPAGIPCNDNYAKDQRKALERNRKPVAYAETGRRDEPADRDWGLEQLTMFQKGLLGFN